MTTHLPRLHASLACLALAAGLIWASGCKDSTRSGPRKGASGPEGAQAEEGPILETPTERAPPEAKLKKDSAQAMGEVFRKLKVASQALVANQTELSLQLHRHTPPNAKGNRILGPWGLSSVLHQVLIGARGVTEAEMRKALMAHLPAEEQEATVNLLNLRLRRAGRNPASVLRLAHRAWAAEQLTLSSRFIGRLQKTHGAMLGLLDFRGKNAKAIAKINAWVSERTQGKIPSILTSVSADTSLLLTSATYFSASWATPFPRKDTRPEPFRTFQGAVPTPMMRQRGTFPCVEAEGVQVVSLPYHGKQFSFLLLLPAPGKEAFERLSERLDTALLNRLKASLQPRNVRVVMPRFALRARQEMRRSLEALGMRRAFTSQADFSGIRQGKAPLWIQEVVHEAYVEVHEEGTEAAAAAGVGAGGGKAPEPPEIRADRPFLFLILHQRTGLILFLGQVANPA